MIPMPALPEDQHLIDLWRQGDENAARQIVDGYLDRLVVLARRHLHQKMAARIDPEDIVQSVFRTFFSRVKEGQFVFSEQDDLTKLLVRITLNKTLRQVAYHRAAKRNPGQEAVKDDGPHDRLQDLLGAEPTPEATVAFIDQFEHLLNQLQPQEREILELRLQGFSNEEIAEKLGIYDRKIRRVIEHIRGIAKRDGLTPLDEEK
jgi:RNA polymerase sigma-70 factor, ECF subfamily